MADPIIDVPADPQMVMYGCRSFVRSWTIKDDNGDPYDFTAGGGWSGSALVKVNTTDADDDAVLTFTTDDSSMVLGDGVGNLRIVMSKADTKTFQESQGNEDKTFNWDLEVTDPGGTSSPVFDGSFTLIAMDTR